MICAFFHLHFHQVEQRLRHHTCGNILPRNRGDPSGGVLALSTPRHSSGPRLRTRTHRDPAGGRPGVLLEHLRASRHADYGYLRSSAFRGRCELQCRVRRLTHQDQPNSQDLRLSLEICRQTAIHQSHVAGLHRGCANRLSGKVNSDPDCRKMKFLFRNQTLVSTQSSSSSRVCIFYLIFSNLEWERQSFKLPKVEEIGTPWITKFKL